MKLSLPPFSTILFDLDNTLIDTKGSDWKACEEKVGVEISYASQCVETFYKLIRTCPEDPINPETDVDEWRILLLEQSLGPSFARYARDAFQIWKETRAKFLILTADVENMLKLLKDRFKLGIITNGPSDAQWEKVHRIGYTKYFDAVIVGGDFPKEKPHRMVFEEAFKRLGVTPEECIMVGDRLETDVQGGINAKVAATVWISRSEQSTVASKIKPDFKIMRVCELLDLIS